MEQCSNGHNDEMIPYNIVLHSILSNIKYIYMNCLQYYKIHFACYANFGFKMIEKRVNKEQTRPYKGKARDGKSRRELDYRMDQIRWAPITKTKFYKVDGALIAPFCNSLKYSC